MFYYTQKPELIDVRISSRMEQKCWKIWSFNLIIQRLTKRLIFQGKILMIPVMGFEGRECKFISDKF